MDVYDEDKVGEKEENKWWIFEHLLSFDRNRINPAFLDQEYNGVGLIPDPETPRTPGFSAPTPTPNPERRKSPRVGVGDWQKPRGAPKLWLKFEKYAKFSEIFYKIM